MLFKRPVILYYLHAIRGKQDFYVICSTIIKNFSIDTRHVHDTCVRDITLLKCMKN